MARQRFLLLHGKHIQQDLTQQPRTRFNEATGEVEPVVSINRQTGQPYYEYPSKVYSQGEELDSDVDLTARFGAEKFRRLDKPAQTKAQLPKGAKPAEDQPDQYPMNLTDPAVAPGGQVTSGYQATTHNVPGPLTPDEATERFGDQVESLTVGEPKRQMGLKEQKGAKTQKEFAREDLKKMPKKELEELAAENEIDIEGAHTKDEIIEKFNPRK